MLTIDATGPLLLFGGPYSNLAASEAMREEACRLGIPAQRVVCTGDVVAYCARPKETVALIRDWGIHVIAGNCEQQLAAGAADCGCGFDEGSACDRLAKGWYPFADGQMSEAERRWMAELPATLVFRYGASAFRVVHGGCRQTARFIFASQSDVIDSECADSGAEVVIAGHCGLPFLRRSAGRVWFNPGVIGMPANDGTPDGWYGLIVPVGGGLRFELHRLPYDFHREAAQLRRCGHADDYARTLVTGLWPSLDVLPEPERTATGKRLRARAVVVKVEAPVGAVA